MQRDPDWYDGTLDFSGPEYAVSFDLGTAVKDIPWDEVERNLLALFTEFGSRMKWEDARPAIYFAWKGARQGHANR